MLYSYWGVLQAEQGQFLLEQLENRGQNATAEDQSTTRKRAPPTCSYCHVQGHTIRKCPGIQAID